MNNKDYIENLLARLTQAKIEVGKEPVILYSELYREVDEDLRMCLNLLYHEGKVKPLGETVNGVKRLKYLLINNNN